MKKYLHMIDTRGGELKLLVFLSLSPFHLPCSLTPSSLPHSLLPHSLALLPRNVITFISEQEFREIVKTYCDFRGEHVYYDGLSMVENNPKKLQPMWALSKPFNYFF
jgi:hypothetical protein